MAEPPVTAKREHDTGAGVSRAKASRKARWVVILGVVFAIALVVLMIFLHLTGTLGPGTH